MNAKCEHPATTYDKGATTCNYCGTTDFEQEPEAMSNTHRAVIASSVPPMLTLIAAGPKDMCQMALEEWTECHDLGEFEEPMILEVVQ